MVAVCEVVDDKRGEWTAIEDFVPWQKAFVGQGLLERDPDLTKGGLVGFKLVDPPSDTRFFLLDTDYVPVQTC